jgi:hypothetical protein
MKIVVSHKKPKFLDTISYKEHLNKADFIFQTLVISQKEYKAIESVELVLNDSQKAYNNCKNHI